MDSAKSASRNQKYFELVVIRYCIGSEQYVGRRTFHVSGRCREETNHIRILAGRYAAMCTQKRCWRTHPDLYPDTGGQFYFWLNTLSILKYRCWAVDCIRIPVGRLTTVLTYTDLDLDPDTGQQIHRYTDLDLYPDTGGQIHRCSYLYFYRSRTVSG